MASHSGHVHVLYRVVHAYYCFAHYLRVDRIPAKRSSRRESVSLLEHYGEFNNTDINRGVSNSIFGGLGMDSEASDDCVKACTFKYHRFRFRFHYAHVTCLLSYLPETSFTNPMPTSNAFDHGR